MNDLNETQKASIRTFTKNKLMSDSVYKVLFDEFTKTKSNDVYVLAASRLAIDFLNEGFKTLKRFVVETDKESKELTNPGL